MQRTKIEWTATVLPDGATEEGFSANPIKYRDAEGKSVWACVKVSDGCKNCYSEATAKRWNRGGPFSLPQIKKVTTYFDEKEAREILRSKEIAGKRVFIGDMTDIFGAWVPFDVLDRLFDTIWNTPKTTFQILTKRPDRLSEYVTKRAANKSFGWTDTSRPPFEPGDFIHFDDVVMRNECGYHEGGYICHHPSKEDKGKEDSCDCRDCPIFYNVTSRDDLQKIGVADEYKFDSDGHADDSQWMELHSRPLHAACGNAWLGFSAENQKVFDERFEHFHSLRWQLGPEFIFFMSLEPLLGPIDIRPALKRHRFSGLPEKDVPHINWVIVGGESGPGARPCNVEWIRSIIRQCKAASVPVFVKQLGAVPTFIDPVHADHCDMTADPADIAAWMKAGERVWKLKDRKGGDMTEWPDDLMVREFPEAAGVRA